MQIIFKIDTFLYTLFPDIEIENENHLKERLEEFYTFENVKPTITINDNWITITVNTTQISKEENDFKKVISLCEKQNYDLALSILEKLLQQNPSHSEYHRVKGQILSDTNRTDEAVNSLIDSLRWNPKNAWALVMMGNIFARTHNDVDTALKYFNQALIVSPNDHIILNNIGANLMQQGDIEEAKKFFLEAVGSNNQYPNTHYALGLINEREGKLLSAFDSTITALKTNPNRDVLYQNSIRQAFQIANKIIEGEPSKELFEKYRYELELKGGREIEVLAVTDIPTVAKIEFAENYGRDKHILKYKTETKGFAHLIMHELVHLDFVIEARENNTNDLFISNQQNKSTFRSTIELQLKDLKKSGLKESTIDNYVNALFEGMNSQIFNAPVDLFIEDKLYKEYPSLHPFQLTSLYEILTQGIEAVTRKDIITTAPKPIISKSKIYNMVGAIQFKELFGIDLLAKYNGSDIETKQANKFYNEFLEYRENRSPGEEFELVQHWADDLNLEKNFELVNEKVFRANRENVDSILENIEANPIEDFSIDPSKVKKMDTFQQTHSDMGINMAIVMFMVDALRYFKTLTFSEIKEIAFEIALQGTQGYDPNKKDYKISHIKEKNFSGYHILAYYYVSWKLAIPDMVHQLQLPFDDEFIMAKTLEDK